ncbi:uncharacterized protein LOC142236187 isoform X2 [Haematobia irritans]|uniref:uncharacterized protein LOC142236187 isoform X2 n=1 Tax=Haematobia irritans TaxID=7368 RepID=UPI003F503F3D
MQPPKYYYRRFPFMKSPQYGKRCSINGSWTGGWLVDLLRPNISLRGKSNKNFESYPGIYRLLFLLSLICFFFLSDNYWNRWQRLQATRTRIYHLFTTDNPQPLEYYCYNSRIHQIEVFCSCLLEKSRKKINEFGTFIYSIILLCVYLF